MPETPEQQSPAILKEIQSAERAVERMVRSAAEEATAMLEQARARAEALLAGRRRAGGERKAALIAAEVEQARRDAERLTSEAEDKAVAMKTKAMSRLDEAAEIVLHRALPSLSRSGGS